MPKSFNLLINTSNKMINIECKGYTMPSPPSCKWCKVQAPSFINESGQNGNNTGALVRPSVITERMYIPACVLGTKRLIKVTNLNISSFGPQSVYPETKMKLIDDEIYQEWDAVFHHQMKHWEEKQNDFREKLRMQKWAVFNLISKHSLNINFLMNY